jgi:proline dehydrogenase
MLDSVPKAVFSGLAGSPVLKRLASRFGMKRPGSFARRFVAGETTTDAIAATRAIEAQGLLTTLDLLGEGVTSVEAASHATAAYLSTIAEMSRASVSRNISIKLTQLGLDIDPATAIDNLRRVLDAAQKADFFVRIDMEGSAYTTRTLETFERVWAMGYRGTGVVIQSALRRSEADLRRVMALGASIRLVKGAYREPISIAYQRKSEVDASYVTLMQILLTGGTPAAIATHDPKMIEKATQIASGARLAHDQFEFQMLYGIRRDLQTSLARAGHKMRIYVPFGTEWFPYFMRRLGERPANVGFVLRSLISDRSA